MKDFYKYKAYYCGLCRTLRDRYGLPGQMTLSYDMTFLILLLTSLYESDTVREQKKCIIHPVKKHDLLHNEITDYVADMNIILTYNHFLDDWKDEKSIAALTGTKIFQRAYKKISRRYPRQCREINDSLTRLAEYEKKGETNIDNVSRCFGELMAALFACREDRWEETLRKMGFYLGKYIYILDAYDDIGKDIKNGCYNPLISIYQSETFEADCRNMLTMMMADCTKEFEKLPCIADADILRNILYEGVWTKFELINKKRNEEKGQTYDNKSI
jgi:hypothetical protein